MYIRKESHRHHYRRLNVHQGQHQYKEMHVCMNCQLQWDEELDGCPPTTGCPYETKIANMGKACEQDVVDRVFKHTGKLF